VAAHPADAEERANGSTEILLPTVAPLIKRISPSVVDVTATKRAGNDRAFIGPDGGFPDPPFPQDVNVAGSGLIVDADRGLIVTANHLVENVDTVTVALVDGRQVSDGCLWHPSMMILRC
jgi:S1-C subfamily serine protease